MRLPDWKKRFRHALRESVSKPFVWGETDCVHFTHGIVRAITGTDFMQNHRYSSEREAIRLIYSAGGLEKLVSSVLSVEPVKPNPKDILPGDVLLGTDEHGNKCVGIAVRATAIFKTKERIMPVPFQLCDLHWRIR